MSGTITIAVNGNERQIPAGTTVGGLLGEMGIDRGRVAVERNRDVVPRARWDEVTLEAGDRLEIVAFVGGG